MADQWDEWSRRKELQKGGGGTVTTPTAATAAPNSWEGWERRKAVETQAPPIPPPPSDGQPDDQPGFWRGLISQLNPVPAAKAMWEAEKQKQKEMEGMNWLERQKYMIGKDVGQATGMVTGMVTGPVETAKDIATDIGARRYRTAAGKIVGIAAPVAAGFGIKKLIPATPRMPKGARALSEAGAEYRRVRAKMPAVPADVVKADVAGASKGALAGSYETREGLREAARQAAKGEYSTYEKALHHKKNVAEPGRLELRPAEYKLDAEGNQVMTKPAIKNTVAYSSPVETAPFRDELAQLIEHDRLSPFPAGHPVRKFLDALGVEKPGVLTADPTVPALAKGYNFYEFDTLKKALGKLSVYADPKGGLRDAYKGLALKILEKAHPIMLDKLKTISKNARIPQHKVVGSLNKGNLEWAKYSAAFRKMPGEIGKAKAAYTRQQALLPGKSAGIKPAPGVTSVPQAVAGLEGVEGRAATAARVSKATRKATSDWVKHSVSNPTNLEEVASVIGDQNLPRLLGALVDDIRDTKDWGKWAKLDPHVKTRLTAHQPDLENSITSVFNQLEKAEELYGAQATQGALTRAITGLSRISTSLPVRYLSPLPKGVHSAVEDWAKHLQNQSSARKLNQALRVQLKRVSTTAKVARAGVRAGATATQVSPAAKMVAEVSPPPERERMAGE